jgi:hypothetical protein
MFSSINHINFGAEPKVFEPENLRIPVILITSEILSPLEGVFARRLQPQVTIHARPRTKPLL